jgi:hypothetical protein
MSTAVNVESRISSVEVTDEAITAQLVDGRVISVPLAWSWRLSEASSAQRRNWLLTGDGHGVHWPDVDEDISAEGMLTGIPARTTPTHLGSALGPAKEARCLTGRSNTSGARQHAEFGETVRVARG